MNEQEQIEWCTRERATIWFGAKGWLGESRGVLGVKVKVPDTSGGIWGATLGEAIAHIERIRKERADIRAALASLPPVDIQAIAVAFPSPHIADSEE